MTLLELRIVGSPRGTMEECAKAIKRTASPGPDEDEQPGVSYLHRIKLQEL
jgi:hypothetical protein